MRSAKTLSNSLGAFTALSAFSFQLLIPTFAHAFAEECDPACAEYKAAFVTDQPGKMSLQYVIRKCGPMPGQGQAVPGAGTGSIFINQRGQSRASSSSGAPASAQGVDFGMRTGSKNWDDCFEGMQGDWNQTGPYCDAIESARAGHGAELIAAIAYATAAAACGVACAYPPAAVACNFGTSIATGIDIYEAQKIDNLLNNFASIGLGVLGTGASIGGSLATATVGGGWERGGACTAAVFMATSCYTRYTAMGDAKETAKQACIALKKLDSDAEVIDHRLDLTAQADTGSRFRADGASGGGPNASGGGTGSRSVPLSASTQRALTDFPNNLKFASATAGSAAEQIFKNIGGKEKMPDVLQQAAGLSLSDLGKRIGSGESLSQIAAKTPGLEALASDFAKIEKYTKETQGQSGSLGSYKSAGGAGAKAAKAPTNPFAMFGGMKGPGGIGSGEAPKDMTFEKAKRELAALDGNSDIWHEGFGGTIFQIVSQKLDRTRERIDELEWESPLNRALTGLPAKKPGRSAAGVK